MKRHPSKTVGTPHVITWESFTRRLVRHLVTLHEAVSEGMPEGAEIGRWRRELTSPESVGRRRNKARSDERDR